MTAATTIVVADDHPAMLAAVSEILERHGFAVVGRAGDGQQAVELIEGTKPQVAIVDARMPRLSGIEVAVRTVASSPETAIIFYTAYGDRALLSEALAPARAPAGRVAKYASDSSGETRSTRPSTRTWRPSGSQWKSSAARGFASSSLPLRLV